MRFAIVVPTLNPGIERWSEWIRLLLSQSVQPEGVIIFDSESSDGTLEISQMAGFDVSSIYRPEFDHGGTRNKAVNRAFELFEDLDVVVLITQDALLSSELSLEYLLDAFSDPDVAVAYGRQVPHDNANALAMHSRKFSYRETERLFSLRDTEKYGLGAVFCSNSFSAYSVDIFKSLNGFPEKNILGEDMHFACNALLKGYKNAYVSNAVVKHSHNYSVMEEFRRYFDTGVFHSENLELFRQFKGINKKGFEYIRSEIEFFFKARSPYIFIAPVYWLAKILGYKLGLLHGRLPRAFTVWASMHKSYWNHRG